MTDELQELQERLHILEGGLHGLALGAMEREKTVAGLMEEIVNRQDRLAAGLQELQSIVAALVQRIAGDKGETN